MVKRTHLSVSDGPMIHESHGSVHSSQFVNFIIYIYIKPGELKPIKGFEGLWICKERALTFLLHFSVNLLCFSSRCLTIRILAGSVLNSKNHFIFLRYLKKANNSLVCMARQYTASVQPFLLCCHCRLPSFWLPWIAAKVTCSGDFREMGKRQKFCLLKPRCCK